MGELTRWLAFTLGLVVVVGTGISMLKHLVVPRRAWSLLPFAVTTVVTGGFRFVVRRLRSYDLADRFLGFLGPVVVVATLMAMLAAFVLGFTLLLAPFESISVPDALRESGSSVTTLGFESTRYPGPSVIDVVAGATGLIVVALTIAYLPTLYSIIRDRERLVKKLEGRAGSPTWGPQVLICHHTQGALECLPAFFADWENWAAEVADTHTKYPVLVTFRLPRAPNHWVLSLLAVLDAAALDLSLRPSAARPEARLVLQMGRRCLRDLAGPTGAPSDTGEPDAGLWLTEGAFADAVRRLSEAGYPLERSAAEAWPEFRSYRLSYEAIAIHIADRVVAPPTRWSGPRTLFPDLEPLPYRPPGPQPPAG